jgi:hypothetical protein
LRTDTSSVRWKNFYQSDGRVSTLLPIAKASQTSFSLLGVLEIEMRPNKITGANAGGLHIVRFPASWAARIAHFCRSA